MAEYIEQDLKARLASRASSPPSLTLHELSTHYQVSPTPVRHALRALIDQKVLKKCGNGRVEIDPSALTGLGQGEATGETVQRPRSSTLLEEQLTAEVIALGLRGKAVPLREEETAERFGVGRTALRQAFNRLAGKGLIDHLPRRGWRVRIFDEVDLTAYLQVREAMELKALELARPHLVPSDLKAMLRGNRRSRGDGHERIDNRLHAYLVEKSGNRYLREFFAGAGAYYTTLFDYAALETRVTSAMARQHRAILRSLLSEDWPSARRILSAHIRAQLPIVKRVMARLAPGPSCHPLAEEPGS